MRLEQLQTSFQERVLSKDCQGADWVRDTPNGLSSKARLGIYHNAYRVRLIEVLRENFEHTAMYLGDDWFEQLASGYVQAHPSSNANIGYYGHAFPAFIETVLPKERDVYELALLDWTLRRAFDGKDAEVMTLEHLGALVSNEPESLRLTPVPTLVLLEHRCNTLDIWHAIDSDNTPPQATTLPQPVTVLTWRKGYSPHFRSISPFEALTIEWLREGYSLNDIGEALQNRFPEIDASLEFGVLLQRWIEEELLAR